MAEQSSGTSQLMMEDYESLGSSHTVAVHMTAGAAAGMAEHCVMFPLDSVKTRLQSLCPCPEWKCPTPIHGIASIARREGFWRTFRGVNAVAIGSVPAHALYFTVYEQIKSFLTGNTHGHWNTLSYGAAGVASTVVHDLVMNPAEVVKQRMQMHCSPYGGSLECVRCIYRNEGLTAFYRSYTTQLLMNVPFQAIHFMAYEFWQELFNPEHQYDPKTHLISGGLAGGLAAAVTNPLDCIKTVLNTQQTPRPVVEQQNLLYIKGSYRGIADSIYTIHANRGFAGFFSGVHARILYQMPSAALSWSVYELFKYLMGERSERSEHPVTHAATSVFAAPSPPMAPI